MSTAFGLSPLLAAPWERPVYLARVASVIERYELLLAHQEAPEGRPRDRLAVRLLMAHPAALQEASRVARADLAVRLERARSEHRLLKAAAPLPAPPERTERALVLAFADFEWLARELRALRRLRRRTVEEMRAAYQARRRLDPLSDLSGQVLEAARTLRARDALGALADLASARHGVSLRPHLWPAPQGRAPTPTRVRVGHRREIPPGAAKRVEAFGRTVAVFNDGGTFYALDDTCPHRGGPLGRGEVEDGCAVCPLHGWPFELATGQLRGNPRVKVAVHPVFLEGDEIFVGPAGAP